MFEITSYTVEWIRDPFGIIPGRRYEFLLDIEVDEEDEMYLDSGLALRLIYKVEEAGASIVKYEFVEKATGKYLDFAMEPEEQAEIEVFCKEHYAEGDDSGE